MAKPKTPSSDLLSVEDLEGMRAELSKDLGLDLLWGSNDEFKLKWLQTGIPAFDRALGGGLPFNRMALVIGEFSAGKTTFVHLVIKAAQALGLSVAYVDAERAWNPDWATALGVDVSKMLLVQPVTGEKAFDAALALVKRRVGVLVIDSLAALTPDAMLANEDEGELFEGKFMGRAAQLNNRGIQALINENKGSLIVVINQLRESIGVTYGNPEQIPGGKAQRFYNSQTIRVRRGAWIEEGTGNDKKRVGYKMRIKLEKNKVGRPYEEGEAAFYFTGEFDEVASLVDQAIELDLITGKPPHYQIPWANIETGELTVRKFYGRARLLDEVKNDAVLQEYIRRQLASVEEADV